MNKNNMKIYIIASGDYFSSYGGGQVYVKNLVAGLKEKGYFVGVISASYNDEIENVLMEMKRVNDIQIVQIFFPTKQIDIKEPIETQDMVFQTFKNVLEECKPSLVHANGWKYAASKICKEMNLPCAVTAHHGGIVCPNGMLMNQYDTICNLPVSNEDCLKCALHFVPGGDFWSPLVSQLPKDFAFNIAKSLQRVRNIPYISPAFQTPLNIANKLKQIDILKNSPDCVIAPSNAIKSALTRNGVLESKVKVIPHGIPPLEAKPLKKGLHERPLRFGYVGRITYVKGLHVLMEALKLLPRGSKYELHIYGEAVTKSEKQYYGKLQKQSEGLNVYWHGKISYDDIAKAYHSFDILVFPSICLEVFGLTVMEALSTGRPVVATRCGGPEDIIRDGIDGVLVETNDPKSLEEALDKMIRKPEIVQKVVEEMQPVISLESHIEMLEKLYFEMIKGKK